jgi:hypothetical protein
LLGISVFIVVILGANLNVWHLASKRNTLYWPDLASVILLPTFWFLVTGSGYGHQSLSHLIEIPIVIMVGTVSLYFRVLIADRWTSNSNLNSYLNLMTGLIFVFLLRTFMPFLPE